LSTLDALPSIAAQRAIEPSKLTSSIRGELDWIVMKCLEKDRARRYESPGALAADIQRHLSDEPVQAAAPSKTYRFRKFLLRHKTGVVTSVIMLLLLIAGIIGTSIGLVRESRQRKVADEQRAEAQHQAQNAKNEAAIAQAVTQFQS